MAIVNKYRIMTGVIIILIATNLSMGISFLYHKQQDKKIAEERVEASIEVPSQQRTRFFREQLNLLPEQVEKFRLLNRDFNRIAWQINHQLERLRIEMVNEMGKENPDKARLKEISKSIGEMHTQLKDETIKYYLSMKETCTEEQKARLNEIFISILQLNEDVKLPQRGRRFRNTR
jgi:Spy/CpxP family protein refolding chaperone